MLKDMTKWNCQTNCETEKRDFEWLESAIEEYDKIFLIIGNEKILDELVELLVDLTVAGNMKKKILVISSKERQIRENISVMYRNIIRDEEEQLYRLYLMYEFSDKFQVVSQDATLYGSLFQLINTEMLSFEEMVSALLH